MDMHKLPERLIPRFSVRRPVTVTMIMLAILVIGTIAYVRISMDLMPEGMNNPMLMVNIPYRNASPKEVEEQIAKNMEGELKTVKSLKRLFSRSSSSNCFFFMEFAQDTNMDLAYSQVADRVERARVLLPSDVEIIYINRRRENDIPMLYLAVSYPEGLDDPYYLIDRYVKRALEGEAGVATVELEGLQEKYIQIVVDSDKIRGYKVNLSRVIQELTQDNFAISSGYAMMGEKKFMLRVSSRFRTLEDVQNIELRKGLRLADVAEVIFDYDEEVRTISRFDGKLAATLVVYKESTANTVEVAKSINDQLKAQFSHEPMLKDLDYFVFFDQGKAIMESIDNVQETAMWGGLFAFLVLFLFLRRLRVTLMITLAIPLCLLITILILYFMGWTLNTITMMGLMLSIGLVVDNAIVISENIYRHRLSGMSAKLAAIGGASEVGLAITLSTLTTIVVFLPMMLMGGDSNMSFIMTRLGAPVIFALLASLVIALMFIPLSSVKLLDKKESGNLRYATHNPLLQFYQTSLVKVFKHRLNSLIVIALLIFSMFIAIGIMKSGDTADGSFQDASLRVRFPPSMSVQKRDEVLTTMANRIWEQQERYELDHVYTAMRRFGGRIELYLKPIRDRLWYQVLWRKFANGLGISDYHRLSREELTADLKKIMPEIPGVSVHTSWQDSEGQNNMSLTYTLRGYDTDVLMGFADELEKQFQLIPDVMSIEDATETGNDEIHVVIDRERAFNIGVDAAYISRYLANTLRPRKVSTFQTDEKEIPVYVKFRPEQRQEVAQLRNTFFQAENGNETTLDALADLSFQKSLGSIGRENGKSFFEITIYVSGEKMRQVEAGVEKILKNFSFPTGYSYEKGSRHRRFREQNSDLSSGLIFSVIFILLIMGVLFESFVLPLSILVAIPAAFVGAFWLLVITGTTFEIMAGIGLVILIGVVVNNGIVLVDMINQYRQQGMDRELAIITAGVNRFRPILMTAMTTICGLLPMAIGNTSLLGIPYTPLGVTMIGGMISSTFLTLFAVPVFYTYFDDMRHFFPALMGRLFAAKRGR